MDKLNDEISTNNSFLNPALFSSTSSENQKVLAENAVKEYKIKAGIFGRIFGTNSELVSKYITILILFVLLLLLIGDFIVEVIIRKNKMNEDLVRWVTPLISLGLGYIFGKK